ncbi:hypothetical protein WH7805_05556 [Synechococcus sp. WH 7805]|nr:hypothetical protein WH7805_05556 [Synechococcus sp. WH 7805]
MDGQGLSGLLLFRFNAPLVFFNANHFLASEGIRLVIAGRRTEFLRGLNAMGMNSPIFNPGCSPSCIKPSGPSG